MGLSVSLLLGAQTTHHGPFPVIIAVRAAVVHAAAIGTDSARARPT